MAKEYYVSIEDDSISPEETLLDSASEFSNIERPISENSFRLVFWGSFAILGVIFLASARLGIKDFKSYSALAAENISSNYSVPAPRGLIYDSSGNPLVQNVSSFDLMAVSKELKPALQANDSTLDGVAKTLGEDPADFKKSLSSQIDSAAVFPVANDIAKDQVLSIQSSKPPGLYIIPDVKRSYLDGPVFSQILGYVGKVNQDDLQNDSYYTINDVTGRLGLEQEYEQSLRGTHGHIQFGQDSAGIDTGAQAGNNLVLNVDSGLQQEMYSVMRNILSSAGLSAGAAIAQDPRTGAVLSLVSFPTYDNNDFVKPLSQSEYDSIFNNPARPLFNRIISGLYNPGSTIKPMMGMMGLQEGVITPDTTIQDCISITIPNPFHPDQSYVFHNWRVDRGPFNLRRSIANSCNVFFATLGGGFGDIQGLGMARIVKYLTKTMADSILGIDLPGEQHGFVPTPDWKQSTRGEPWYQGDTYNVSIGQGDLTVTPLWLNTYISAVANGGTMYKPEVVNRIVDDNGKPIQVFKPEELEKLPFDPNVVATVHSDMQETILSGTATLLKDLPVTAAAKTGTAQVVNGQKINSFFTVFAPVDHPQVAMTFLVESPNSEGLAIVAANDVLKWYFTQGKGNLSAPVSSSSPTGTP